MNDQQADHETSESGAASSEVNHGRNSGRTRSTAESIRSGSTLKPPLLHDDMHDHAHSSRRAASGSGRISRTLVNFWLDTLLGTLFATLCLVAVIVQFIFPPGVAARDWSLWGLGYGGWCSLQFGLIAVLSLGILLHVMLHWTWVCGVLTRRVLGGTRLPDDGIRTIYGVGLLICLLLSGAVAVGLAQWMIVSPD